VHTAQSGVADHYAENEEHALELARGIVATLASDEVRRTRSRAALREPLYPGRGNLRRHPVDDSAQPYDVREVIARIVDGSRFHEFKARYGDDIGHAASRDRRDAGRHHREQRHVVFGEALKGAHFVELCCQRKIPLLFVQNITGFMVGKEYERGGIAKDGAKMVHAVANANVPKLTVCHRRQFRRGKLRHVRPRVSAALYVDVAERAHLASWAASRRRMC
jgi:3-methylcrotonyl-CoA carboxylase beta subunit